MTQYPFQPLETRVNGVDIRLVGVEHTPEFFDRHRSFFEEEINKSRAIALESCAGLVCSPYKRGYFFGFLLTEIQHEKPTYLIDRPVYSEEINLSIATGLMGGAIMTFAGALLIKGNIPASLTLPAMGMPLLSDGPVPLVYDRHTKK